MEQLNYHHLRLFWEVAKADSITAACRQLNLAQPTVSAQLQVLERTLNCELFSRRGRNLKLTPTGERVMRRADEIFELGRELLHTINVDDDRVSTGCVRLYVGLANSLPKLLVYRLLSPAFDAPKDGEDRVHLVCVHGGHQELLSRLAAGELDMILTDAPVGGTSRVRAYNHHLGSCTTSIFASKNVSKEYKDQFPFSLHGAPFLMPSVGSALRRNMDNWFTACDMSPHIIGEFDDNALVKAIAQSGRGLFATPTVEAQGVLKHYSNVELLGEVPDMVLSYYVVSAERRVRHPAAVAILEHARNLVF